MLSLKCLFRNKHELSKDACIDDAQKSTANGAGETRKKLTWSKIMMVVMIAICLEIIVFAEMIMWYTLDTSSLYALVGIAASLAASIWAYCEKAKAENTAGGITYDTAMKNADENVEETKNEDGTFG